ncbi:MAG: hypothetical protein ACO331_09125 [Prochlorothrix sp.]
MRTTYILNPPTRSVSATPASRTAPTASTTPALTANPPATASPATQYDRAAHPAPTEALTIFKHYWRDALHDAVLHQGQVYLLHKTFAHEADLHALLHTLHWAEEGESALMTQDAEGYKLWLEHFCPVYIPYVRGNPNVGSNSVAQASDSPDSEEPTKTKPCQITWDWLDQHLPDS